jgi:DNA-binding response OmpR family regulator
VLRHAGFVVDEAFNLKGALGLVKLDLVDVLLLCHTLSKTEQRWLIAEVRKVRRMLPIVCVQSHDHDSPQADCTGAPNDPAGLVETVMLALRLP